MSDNTYEEESSRVSKRNGGKIRSGVGRSCHKYMFSGKRAIYICGRASSFTSDVDMLDFDPNLRKVKDTSVLVRILETVIGETYTVDIIYIVRNIHVISKYNVSL